MNVLFWADENVGHLGASEEPVGEVILLLDDLQLVSNLFPVIAIES